MIYAHTYFPIPIHQCKAPLKSWFSRSESHKHKEHLAHLSYFTHVYCVSVSFFLFSCHRLILPRYILRRQLSVNSIKFKVRGSDITLPEQSSHLTREPVGCFSRQQRSHHWDAEQPPRHNIYLQLLFSLFSFPVSHFTNFLLSKRLSSQLSKSISISKLIYERNHHLRENLSCILHLFLSRCNCCLIL